MENAEQISGRIEPEQNQVIYKIQNVVTSVSLNQEIDLDHIANSYKDVNFNMNRFPGLCVKISKPKCVILIFKNGKMVITGLKRISDIPIVLQTIRKKLLNIKMDIPPNPEYRVVNLVVSGHINKKNINLDIASMKLEGTIYEPEVFPGMIFRMIEPVSCVFLVFSTGKFVITGLKREMDIEKAIISFGKALRVKELFSEYRL